MFRFDDCRALLVPRFFGGHVVWEEKIGIPSHYVQELKSRIRRSLGIEVTRNLDDEDGWVYSRCLAAEPLNFGSGSCGNRRTDGSTRKDSWAVTAWVGFGMDGSSPQPGHQGTEWHMYIRVLSARRDGENMAEEDYA
jgi:hypothetical protein